MDVERSDNFLPVRNLTEEVKRIAMMKAALKAFTNDHERSLLVVQKRLKAGKRLIDICVQEFNSLESKINAVESRITESLVPTQASETEALKIVRENRQIKRKIISLKHDMNQQEKLLNRANETMNVVRTNATKNKKMKTLPALST